MAPSYRIINGMIAASGILLEGGSVTVENGIITEVLDKDQPSNRSNMVDHIIDAHQAYVVPGFCDLHIHGCAYWGFEDITEEEFRKAQEYLAVKGILSFLPTLQCDEQSICSLAAILDSLNDREAVPGIYIEGPFASADRRGGINKDRIHPPDTDHLKRILDWGRGYIKMMTVAPELPGIDSILKILLDSGIVPSLGHSDATFDQAKSFLEQAGTLNKDFPVNVTHLFNASSPISHKSPGLAFLPFLESCYFEVNGDGKHIHDRMLQFIHRYAPKERMILISDALISAGLEEISPEQLFTYYGDSVSRKPNSKGVFGKNSEVLTGSSCLLDEVLGHYRSVTGADVSEIVQTASENPYALIGLGDKLGKIAPGYQGRVLLVDNDFKVISHTPMCQKSHQLD